MKRLVVFGDSFAEGKSFVSKLHSSYRIKNLALSGTTVGDYSIYPVGRNCLLDRLYDNKKVVKKADIIMLEYGINDASSMYSKYADITGVMFDLVKAYDFIKQNNPAADIVFVLLTNKPEGMLHYASTHAKYIKNEYTRGVMYVYDTPYRWKECYQLFAQAVRAVFGEKNVIYMVDKMEDLTKNLCSDKMHPNELGHSIIARNILKYMQRRGKQNGNKRF